MGASADPNLPSPCAYFQTDATSREVEVELPRWAQGRYVMVKLLDTHGRQEPRSVGDVGFCYCSPPKLSSEMKYTDLESTWRYMKTHQGNEGYGRHT